MLNHSFFTNEQFKRPLDVVCVENALIDLLIRGSDADLKSLGMNKGIMQLVDIEVQNHVLQKLGQLTPEVELGGSGANVIRGLATLGAHTCYSSSVATDRFGKVFSNRLAELNIENRLAFKDVEATGTCLVVVTPDSERTLNTHLGACRLYQKEDLPLKEIEKSKLFFSTGYMLDTQNQIDALHAAMDHAHKHDVKVAFDVADPFVVLRHGKETLLNLFQKTHAVFANAQESEMLFGCQGEKGVRELGKIVPLAIVKDGANGAYLMFDGKVSFIPAMSVEATDTTGAGDMFAGGFLYGLCKGYNLSRCGQIASLLASNTVSHFGVRLSSDIKERIQKLDHI